MSKSTGALFKNDKKSGDNHPDYRGDFKLTKELLDDLNYAFGKGLDKVQLAGWIKPGREGKPSFMSLAVQPPYDKDAGNSRPQQQSRPASRDMNDDIPF